MKNRSDPIRNRTRELSALSAFTYFIYCNSPNRRATRNTHTINSISFGLRHSNSYVSFDAIDLQMHELLEAKEGTDNL
jgi:hypothetical protein